MCRNDTMYCQLAFLHLHYTTELDFYPVKGGYRDALDAIDKQGHVPVPQKPGLGVEIDWDWVEKHRTGLVEYS